MRSWLRSPARYRGLLAGSVMVLGVVGGFSSAFMAMLQYGGGMLATEPWQLYFALYLSGAVLSVAIPQLAWWILMPRARRWGAAVMGLMLALYIVIILIG